jgi:hypothetical protein
MGFRRNQRIEHAAAPVLFEQVFGVLFVAENGSV